MESLHKPTQRTQPQNDWSFCKHNQSPNHTASFLSDIKISKTFRWDIVWGCHASKKLRQAWTWPSMLIMLIFEAETMTADSTPVFLSDWTAKCRAKWWVNVWQLVEALNIHYNSYWSSEALKMVFGTLLVCIECIVSALQTYNCLF